MKSIDIITFQTVLIFEYFTHKANRKLRKNPFRFVPDAYIFVSVLDFIIPALSIIWNSNSPTLNLELK